MIVLHVWHFDAIPVQIIVDDCMIYLDRFIKEGRKFDYVFGDLTDIPISDTPTGEMWNFIRSILEHSFKILKPTGKYLTHGNGSNSPESLAMFEEQLSKLAPKVKFTRANAFVPSFMWVLSILQFLSHKHFVSNSVSFFYLFKKKIPIFFSTGKIGSFIKSHSQMFDWKQRQQQRWHHEMQIDCILGLSFKLGKWNNSIISDKFCVC